MPQQKHKTQFPHWAPKELCDLRSQLGPRNGRLEAEWLDRLLTDSRMEKVWEVLAKCDRDNLGPRQLLRILVAEEKTWRFQPKLSTAELRDTYREVIRLATSLAQLLDGRLSDPSIEQLWHFVDVEAFRKCLNPEATPGVALSEHGLPEFTEDHWMAFGISRTLPPIQDVLTKLVESAKENLITAKGLPQPGHPNARAFHMSKYIHAWFRVLYKVPLYDQVATIVNTLLNTDIDAETIRLRIHQFRKRRKSKNSTFATD